MRSRRYGVHVEQCPPVGAEVCARQRMLNRLADYLKAEYDRRIRRHAFYEDLGYGGKSVANQASPCR